MPKKLLFIMFLLGAVVQGAWAQANWEEVYAMTETTSADWTQLNAGSTTGKTIGSAGNTTYLYADANLTFSNSTAGGSGLTILGTVYLYLPEGVTVTCTGANADGQTGGGAGIEVAAGNSLILLGKGTVNATGGNAANGGNGANGHNASCDFDNSGAAWVGGGGTGGNGGGGAGAGIGTRGGNGGAGGSAAESEIYYKTWTENGVAGSAGGAGLTADAMGNLYATKGITVNATGGSKATTAGTAGSAGKSYLRVGGSAQNDYSLPGGGGGGGGGFGGAASGIGSGGPGGGGGGGGAKGGHSWTANDFFKLVAKGGAGGQSADGFYAADGGTAEVSKAYVANGLCDTNNAKWVATAEEKNGGGVRATTYGGSGGAAGSASKNRPAVTFTYKMPSKIEWEPVCLQTKTSQSQWQELSLCASTGITLGTVGATTYYYASGNRSFFNGNAGGSGLTILGTVYIFIPSGQTITCTGADASGTTGAGAGIELTAGNTLYLIGSGKLVATGGNAAGGGNGGNGADASFDSSNEEQLVRGGAGGRGGDGGGGAGAGIGTCGAAGGVGGTGGAEKELKAALGVGNAGSAGTNGGTAADMGTLYIYESPALTTEIHGGSSGTAGKGGKGGLHAFWYYPYHKQIFTMSGGAGGGVGGFGGAASDIGTGGPGGGGGGGGASGSIKWNTPINGDYAFMQVGANGGSPGSNGDGTLSDAGETLLMVNDKDNMGQKELKFKEYTFRNGGWYKGRDDRAAGGAGGSAGSASQSGSATIVEVSNSITLANSSDNSAAISEASGSVANVTLTGRTFYKDGSWNTLCLPFNLDNFNGTPLEGATVKTLASTSFEGGTLTMIFSDDLTSITAGTPYIVKWVDNIKDLSTLTADYTAQDGDVLTGTLGADVKIAIAAGATVALQNATINGRDSDKCKWAGITCLGDATIVLRGTNTVKGFHFLHPGIYVPKGSTLTIKGGGSLDASSNGYGAGIGGAEWKDCGNIVIEGGTINATGGTHCAGIGGGGWVACGDITITDGVTSVTATKGYNGKYSIGEGYIGIGGTVTIGGKAGAPTDSPYSYKGTGSGSVDVMVKYADIVDPVFKGVSISNVTANAETDYVDFIGTYAPVSIYTAEKTNLYLGADDMLYSPSSSDFQVNACRGYFQLKQALTAGEPININFGGDDNKTGVIELKNGKKDEWKSLDSWYTLDGRKLDGKPTRRGIYINNGKKVVMK